MKLPLFISYRYIRSNKDSRLLNIISVITVTGIALGVATLIIALSVLIGFEKTLTEKITDFDNHIVISSYKGNLPNSDRYIENINKKIKYNVDFINPYLSKLCIISSKDRKEGLNVTGITLSKATDKIKSNLIDGKFNLNNPDDLIIGKSLATKLLVKVGDKVTLFALKNDELPSPANLPNIERFKIAGIFESGMAEYDNMIGYTSLTSAQKLFSLDNEINGIDIKLKSVEKIDSLAKVVRMELRYPYYARTIFEIHRNIFTWIELQKQPIPIILGLIIIVAVFNIISALLMLVLEKTNAIGVLKSLGAKGKSIVKIFIYQGIYLTILGILTGNILAWSLMSIQLKFNLIKVPSSVYFVTKVPIEMKLEIFLLISVITFILSIIAAILPSLIASKISPIKALRFD